jgi:5-dehydro-2-deoxygluconokinase
VTAQARVDVACIGRAAVDLYGEQVGCGLEEVSTFARYLGGSPANTAIGAARLGLRSAMISRVGDEQNGRFVRATLAREGVDVSQVSTDPARLTALVFLAIRGRGDFPHVFYRDNCADMALAPEDIDPAFLARCDAVLVSGTHLSSEGSRAACERAVEAARATGARVILDIDYRPVLWGLAAHGEGAQRYAPSAAAAMRIGALLPRCDLVVGTEEEFRVAGGSDDLLAALRHVRAQTAALLVVKLGARGCVAFEGRIPAGLEQGLVVEGFPVEVFNALGAGDAFMAGFLRGWLRGEPLATCCRYANACGAIVVSRHGCAPAMATMPELAHFLARGPATPRLREDRELSHIHRATTRAATPGTLFILAFDHRTWFEALAARHGAPMERIADFKALVARAFERVAGPGHGVILDDRHGEAILPQLAAFGRWIARPVETPNALPLAFEAGDGLALALRAWPASHVAKCLAYFHPGDSGELRALQLERLAALAAACEATGREMLVELLPPPGAASPAPPHLAMEAIYRAGIRPDWWKLPPAADGEAWREIDAVIGRNDPLCRGVLVLGMDAGLDALAQGFKAAAACRRLRGFAVGRSIFGPAAEAWFSGAWTDTRVVDEVAARYSEVIGLWEGAGITTRETA